MRSRSNGGVIGAYALPNRNHANGVFFIHDAAIYNTGSDPIWPLGAGFIYSASGGTISTASNDSNFKTHTFTANSSFTVVDGAGFVEILLVGGGGAGGVLRNAYTSSSFSSYGTGGGGGGAVTVVSTFVQPGTTFTVEVGQGAIPDTITSSAINAEPGKPSKVTSTAGHSYIANGGGSAWGAITTSASSITRQRYLTAGGCGAGGAIAAGLTAGSSSTAVSPSVGYAGDYASIITNVTNSVAGGGGGAASIGKSGPYSWDLTKSGYGGDGYLWARTNSYYGAGGGGARGYAWNFAQGYPGNTPALGGLQGPAATAQVGYGNGCSPSNSTTSATGVAALAGYGGGSGGSIVQQASTASFNYSPAGASGAVIFCYRYR